MRHAFPPAFCWGTHLCVGSIHDEVAEQKCIMISSALLSPIHEMVERDPCTDIDPGVFSYLKNSRLVRIQQAGRKSIHIITVWLHSRHVTPCDTNSSTCDVINAKIIKIPSRVKNWDDDKVRTSIHTYLFSGSLNVWLCYINNKTIPNCTSLQNSIWCSECDKNEDIAWLKRRHFLLVVFYFATAFTYVQFVLGQLSPAVRERRPHGMNAPRMRIQTNDDAPLLDDSVKSKTM